MLAILSREGSEVVLALGADNEEYARLYAHLTGRRARVSPDLRARLAQLQLCSGSARH